MVAKVTIKKYNDFRWIYKLGDILHSFQTRCTIATLWFLDQSGAQGGNNLWAVVAGPIVADDDFPNGREIFQHQPNRFFFIKHGNDDDRPRQVEGLKPVA